jgi:hypothetical protein
MLLVVDQMRKIRQENKQLHKTIIDLHTWQKNADGRLASIEGGSNHLQLSGSTSTCTSTSVSSTPFASSSTAPMTSASRMPFAPAARHGSELEEFIEQSLPFLRHYDISSFIIKDHRYSLGVALSLSCCGCGCALGSLTVEPYAPLHRRPWMLLRIQGAETINELEVPIIFHASPALCHILGYETVHTLPRSALL